ncbi:MAG: glycosyltransferase family 9 protein [Chitinispirillaceae bacterium]|nr:glycosyltransferase family 9 protein [Chitinispirillaceae bacterium]
MNILVIRFTSLGDVVLVTALFSYLAERYPDAGITFITSPEYAPLFHDDRRLQRTLVVADVDDGVKGGPWDLVVDLQNNRRSRRLVATLRSRPRVGRFDKMHLARWALLALRLNIDDHSRHVAARYIAAAAEGSDQPVPPSPRLFFSEECRNRPIAWYREQTDDLSRPSIALFPFSAWKNKEWPLLGYRSVGGYFLAKGWNVAIFGSSLEAARAEVLSKAIGSRCVSTAGKLSLHECGALLTHFSLALGNDTGLAHLARAAGVKTGILFGPTTRQFGFYPYGEPPSMVFEKELFCRPCHAHGGNRCLRLTRPCMRSIDDREVVNGLERLLQSG